MVGLHLGNEKKKEISSQSHFILYITKLPPHIVTKLQSLSHKAPPSFLQGAEAGRSAECSGHTHITLQLSQCACQELKPCTAEHWEERHTKVVRGRPDHILT